MTTINQPVFFPGMVGLLALASVGVAQAQDERGRVISSTPVVQAIAVPRQVCQEQVVGVQGQRSGAGAIIGGIAGGALGHAVGEGSGRAVATVIGVVGGALLGDRIEGHGQARNPTVQPCSTQNFYENRTVAYNVVYEYAGRQYTTQMPQDPGRYVRLSVTPVNNLPPARYGRPFDAQDQPRAPVLIRSSVGMQFYPAYPVAPRVVYVNGYSHAPVQQFHPHRDRRDWHDRHEHRSDRQENRWERDGR